MIGELKTKLEYYNKQNLKFFTTCSFQTHSIVLLHMLIELYPNIPVYFIDTGFHFKETLEFRDSVTKSLNLNLHIISSNNNEEIYKDDLDRCCNVNKVNVLDRVLSNYDIWINGIRKSQSKSRSHIEAEEISKNIIKFRPLIDWNDDMIEDYIEKHNLPRHPLNSKDYYSIGCQPCTSKAKSYNRNSRWKGTNKTECGLHFTK
jgi:phosphoadenosine phosphosulfate reductase